MLLECTLLSMEQPQNRALEPFRNDFNNVRRPQGELPMLGSRSQGSLDNGEDLVALRAYQEDDKLTSFLDISSQSFL